MKQTSIDAYEQIKSEGLLTKRKLEVYQILKFHGPMTAHEVVGVARSKYPLANQTGFNARLSELEKLGCVEIADTKTNPVSGKQNYVWRVTNNLPKKLIKPSKIKCPHCDGLGYTEQGELF